MRIKNTATSLILIFIVQMSYAQIITGVVKDTTNNPVSYATVVLHSLPDTTYVSGTITNLDGHFELNATEGKDLLLQVSSIGYKTRYLPAIIGQIITLEQDIVLIGEVVILD